ncbi:hypothetical protein AMTRI_Chr04g188660 [Amborella trichopoda]
MGDGNRRNMNKKKKNRRKKKKKMMNAEETFASKCVWKWANNNGALLNSSSSSSSSSGEDEDFNDVQKSLRVAEPVVFELHSHSTRSDGFLSPTALVERAHRSGVKILALTDHDTMAGIPEALEAARKFGIRIIPGVEISTMFSPRGNSGTEEPVHILAYYSSCGPAKFEELEECLVKIRDGRFRRAKDMLLKLNKLKIPIKWEHVARIAGNGVAPGRLHVARALVEAGHVENLRQAFSKYLYDGGPAYAKGNELLVEEAVQLICRTGGVAALAHPWALKNPIPIIRSLKASGLHAMEVYRSDGRLAAFSDLADAYELLKLGGSDFHGRGGHDESELGSVNLPVVAVHEFLTLARPIWCDAIRSILLSFAEEDPNKVSEISKFKSLKGDMTFENTILNEGGDMFTLHLSSWLSNEERKAVEVEAIRLKLSHTVISERGFHITAVSK